jgi:pyridoxine 5-phosphate synthase
MNPLISAGLSGRQNSTALSVNVNKVALLRNTRTLGIPSVTVAATHALKAGAHGITVHPRPDGRHIRFADVLELGILMKDWPQAEFNIEGNPLHNLMEVLQALVEQGLPVHQCTFVPDGVEQSTSDHGWNLPQDMARLKPLIAQAQSWGLRVSLFMDPLPHVMAAARATGADRVELYTENYARAYGSLDGSRVLDNYVMAAEAALGEGLRVHAGHDLNRHNLAHFLNEVPGVSEVSIGHALVADALDMGMASTVQAYLRVMASAHPLQGE